MFTKILLLCAALGRLSAMDAAAAGAALDAGKFKEPDNSYRPIDTWWWDGAPLDAERLKWQLGELKAQGSGGTWLYPRFGASQPLSAEPGFWTEGWWRFVGDTLAEHERLGMVQWANDWLGRLTKHYFQDRLREMRAEHPELTGIRLVLHRSDKARAGVHEVTVPEGQVILAAAAYRRSGKERDGWDGNSRMDLLGGVKDRRLTWTEPVAGWMVAVVAAEPSGLNYLHRAVADRWIEIFLARYAEQAGPHLGKSLTAYGPDERQVLNGDLLYSEELRERLATRKGLDLLPHLPALFLDVGPLTDRIRCCYHEAVADLLEERFYAPIQRWLHDHDMQQATIATWGRRNICGQTYNYGDFFRMMKYFDITGNEDSVESGENAFIDTKLSSSIAHLNGHRRVAVCGYWGTGWGFTQEDNLARTNINFALGVNLFNTHGAMYSLMGGRNEFVPPAVQFYQPYWQTWRTFYDRVARLSYALSQGAHRAEVAIVYPLSTLHAHWNGHPSESKAFGPAARTAEQAMFAIGEAVYQSGQDFDFIDEKSIAAAAVDGGVLAVPQMQFSVVVLPAMTTIPLEAAQKLGALVKAGGMLVAAAPLPAATPEQGRDDPALARIWHELFGAAAPAEHGIVRGSCGRGQALLVPGPALGMIPGLIRSAITPAVRIAAPDVISIHRQAGAQHLYYFVNKQNTRRALTVVVQAQGDPELWDADTGLTHPLHRFASGPDGTELHLEFEPRGSLLVVLQPRREAPQVLADQLQSIDRVETGKDVITVSGTADGGKDVSVTVRHGERRYTGTLRNVPAARTVTLDSAWECEYRPTMDNRWGDFRHPAGGGLIGPEMPVLCYRAETSAAESRAWSAAGLDDSMWETVTCTFGPHWRQLGPFSAAQDSEEITARIVAAAEGAPPALSLQGAPAAWTTHVYSLKHGSGRVDVNQQKADDGLGPPPDEFLVLDRLPGEASVCYLTTRVYSPADVATRLHFGAPEDRVRRQAWLNGKSVITVDGTEGNVAAPATLTKGWNHLLLRLELPPRSAKALRTTKGLPPLSPPGNRVQTYAVFHPAEVLPPAPRYLPVLRWYRQDDAPVLDCGDGTPQTGWFRFPVPPGAVRAKLNLNARTVEAWLDGKKAVIRDGVMELGSADGGPAAARQAALRVEFLPGFYGGAAFTDPVRFETGKGIIRAGDWCRQGLAFYSGGVHYGRTLTVEPGGLERRLTLDLGEVKTSAELFINGKSAGVRLAPPFRFDLSGHLHEGENRITVSVLNTLANHMSALPTRYVYPGQTVSGLLGPVTLQDAPRVTVECRPE